MFARQAFRPVSALNTQARRYASTAPSGGSGVAKYAVALGAAGAAWYAYSSFGGSTADVKAAAKKLTGNEAKVFTGGEQGFVSLKLAAVENINHNTKKLRFTFEDPEAISGLSVASALLTKYKGPEDAKPTLRPYTPISDEDSRGYLDLLVKKYEGGPMSTHLHDLAIDQRLDFKGPLPKYAWSENKHEHIALIAGGTGITPMYQLIRAIFANPNDKTNVSLVYGSVTEGDILLKKELAKIENEFPTRFRAFYVLDNPPEKWQGGSGFITKELLKTVLPTPEQGEKVKVFVCGPPGLYKAISGGKKSPQDQGELAGYLKELGYSKDQVYKF